MTTDESWTYRSSDIIFSDIYDGDVGRFVDTEELLGGAFFLCDDKSASVITGVVLPIGSGFSAYSGV